MYWSVCLKEISTTLMHDCLKIMETNLCHVMRVCHFRKSLVKQSYKHSNEWIEFVSKRITKICREKLRIKQSNFIQDFYFLPLVIHEKSKTMEKQGKISCSFPYKKTKEKKSEHLQKVVDSCLIHFSCNDLWLDNAVVFWGIFAGDIDNTNARGVYLFISFNLFCTKTMH